MSRAPLKRSVINTVIGCLAFMALLLGLLVHRVLSPVAMSNQQLSDNGLFVYDVPRRISEFELTDQYGEPFTQEWLKGKWSLLFFGYTYCPDICPITMATIRQFEEILKGTEAEGQTQVAMISVDPERDTPEKLRAYVEFFDDDYIGATDEFIKVFTLARQLNIAFGYQPVGDDGSYLVNHSGEIVLINPNGHFHGMFKIPHDPEKMARTFRSVLSTWH